MKLEIESATVDNFFGMRKVHQQEINIKFETYLRVVLVMTRKRPLFFDRFVINFAVRNFKDYDVNEDVSISVIQYAEIQNFQELILRWISSEKLKLLGITIMNIYDENTLLLFV